MTPAVIISFRAMIRFSSDVDKKLAYIIAFTLLHSSFYSSNLSTFAFLIYCQPRRARPQGHIVWARKTRNGRGGECRRKVDFSSLIFLSPQESPQGTDWHNISSGNMLVLELLETAAGCPASF